jgi:hypothetical protein
MAEWYVQVRWSPDIAAVDKFGNAPNHLYYEPFETKSEAEQFIRQSIEDGMIVDADNPIAIELEDPPAEYMMI